MAWHTAAMMRGGRWMTGVLIVIAVGCSDPAPSTETAPATSTEQVTESTHQPTTSSTTTVVPTTTSGPTTTAATVVVELPGLDVDVTAVQAAPRTVLAVVPIGDGEGDLGLDRCQECDQTRPWSPVMMPDGSLVIADTVHHRWLVVAGEAITTVPWPEGLSVAGQPSAVGDSGLLVVPMTDAFGDISAFVVDVHDLSSPISITDVPDPLIATVLCRGPRILVNGQAVENDVPLDCARVDPRFNVQPATVDIEWHGESRVFTFPLGFASALVGSALDGTVVVEGADATGTTTVMIRLGTDGQVGAAMLVGDNFAWNNSRQVLAGAVVQIELSDDGASLEVVRYEV